MNQHHRMLSVAIATVLAGISQSSTAAPIDIDLKSPSAIVIAAENPTSTGSVINPDKIVLKIPAPALSVPYPVNSANAFFTAIKLTNGVTFTGTWDFKCKVYTAGTPGSGWAPGSLNVGAGTDSVTFTLPSEPLKNKSIIASAGCRASGTTFGLNSGLKDSRFSASIQYKDGSVTKYDSYTGSLISISNALNTVIGRSGTNAVVDVVAGSKEFTQPGDIGSVTNPTSNTKYTAFLGHLQYKGGAIAAKLAKSASTSVTAGHVVGTLTITLNGAVLGAVAQTGGVYISNSPTCANATNGALRRASGTTVTFNVAASTAGGTWANAGGALNGGLYFCLNNKGANVLTPGTITATLTGTGKDSFRPNFGSPGQLVTITKNGASTRVLNIPSPTDKADVPAIRINNMVNVKGNVFGTLYSQAGTVIGTPNVTLATVNERQAVVLSATDLATKFGIDPTVGWTGRAWLQIDSDLADIAVQGLMRNAATGTLFDLSRGVEVKK